MWRAEQTQLRGGAEWAVRVERAPRRCRSAALGLGLRFGFGFGFGFGFELGLGGGVVVRTAVPTLAAGRAAGRVARSESSGSGSG